MLEEGELIISDKFDNEEFLEFIGVRNKAALNLVDECILRNKIAEFNKSTKKPVSFLGIKYCCSLEYGVFWVDAVLEGEVRKKFFIQDGNSCDNYQEGTNFLGVEGAEACFIGESIYNPICPLNKAFDNIDADLKIMIDESDDDSSDDESWD